MSHHRDKPTSQHKDASRQKFVRKAIESASEYNLFLNRQRRLERSVYMDLQTDTPNYPVGLGRQNKTLSKTTKIGRYPIAVMPSQYQDWYIEYTPQELQFLPVDTILKGPIMNIDKLPPVLTTPDVSDFDTSDSDDDSQGSSSSSSSDEDASPSAAFHLGFDGENGTTEQQPHNATNTNTTAATTSKTNGRSTANSRLANGTSNNHSSNLSQSIDHNHRHHLARRSVGGAASAAAVGPGNDPST